MLRENLTGVQSLSYMRQQLFAKSSSIKNCKHLKNVKTLIMFEIYYAILFLYPLHIAFFLLLLIAFSFSIVLEVAAYFDVFFVICSSIFNSKHFNNFSMTQDFYLNGISQVVRILTRDIWRENPFKIWQTKLFMFIKYLQ